jgi:hypothetical protein
MGQNRTIKMQTTGKYHPAANALSKQETHKPHCLTYTAAATNALWVCGPFPYENVDMQVFWLLCQVQFTSLVKKRHKNEIQKRHRHINDEPVENEKFLEESTD